MKSIKSSKSAIRGLPIPPAINTSGALLISGSGSCTISNLGTNLSNSWTIETWMYIPSIPPINSTTKYTVFSGIPNSTYSPYALSVSYINSSSTYLTLSVGNGTTSASNILNELTGSGTGLVNIGWHHFAVTYSSTSGYTMWQDGTLVNSSSITTSISSLINSIVVGSYKSSTSSSTTNFAEYCYFSQLRISKNVRYTDTFIPAQTYGIDINTIQYFPFSGSNNQSSSLTAKTYGTTQSSQISSAIISLTNSYISSSINLFNPGIPKKYSGLQLWLDSYTYSSMTFSGSAVLAWNDQSSYSRTATLLSGTSYPIYSLSGFNSLLPGIKFSTGQGFYVSCPTGTFTNGVTLFVVFQKSGSANTYETLVSRTLSGLAAPWDMFNNNRLIGTGSSWVGDYSNLNIQTSTGPNVLNALITSNYWQEYRNGTPVSCSKPKATFTDNSSYLYIGTRDNGTSSFTGTISEVLVYNRLLDPRSRLDIESYLMSKWIWSSLNNLKIPSTTTSLSASMTSISGVFFTGNYTTLSNISGYNILVITGGGLLSLSSSRLANVLIVGGGGGGGYGATNGGEGAGGGGGGGVGIGSLTFSGSTNYIINVGNGGTGGIYSNLIIASTGGTSSIIGGSINEIAYGGGTGGSYYNIASIQVGGAGGSSGGGNGGWSDKGSTTATKGSGTLNYYGNNGGTGIWNGTGGGGGGASSTGSNGTNTANGAGGAGGTGLTWSINGTVYGGGGGGGLNYNNTNSAASGGNGGGGNGGSKTVAAMPGTANTGGGGGGASTNFGNGGNGGSGVIMLAFPTTTSSGTPTYYNELQYYRYDNTDGTTSPFNLSNSSNINWFSGKVASSSGTVSSMPYLSGENSGNPLSMFGISGSGSNVALLIKGSFKPSSTGIWNFGLQADDCAYSWIGSPANYPLTSNTTSNKLIYSNSSSTMTTGSVFLNSGIYYPILVLWGQSTSGSALKFSFQSPSGSYITNGSGYFFNDTGTMTSSSGTTTSSSGTPTTISGCQLWLDASLSSSITLSGTAVTQWADRSTNSRNATTYLTGTTYPSYSVTAMKSAYPGINFVQGAGFSVSCLSGTFSSGVTFFVVFTKSVVGGSYETLVTRTIGNKASCWDQWNTQRYLGNGSTNFTTTASFDISTASGSFLYSAVITPTSWNEYINGSLSSSLTGFSTNTYYTDGASNIYIASRQDKVTGFTGTISEVIVYNRALNSTDRSTIETYLNGKWLSTSGTTSTSPTTFAMTGSPYISTSYYKIGAASLFLPNTDGNRLVMSNFPGSSRLSTSLWTIEFFVYPTSSQTSERVGISFGSSNSAIAYCAFMGTGDGAAANKVVWYMGTANGTWNIFTSSSFTSTTNYTIGAWNHVALTLSGNTYSAYLNGSRQYTNTNSTNIGALISQFYFGAYCSGGTFSLNGGGRYFDGLRITSDVLYTGTTYTVPTSYIVSSSTIYVNSFEGTNNSTTFTTGETYYITVSSSGLIMDYRFNSLDVSGTKLLNFVTSSYDLTLNSISAISTDQKLLGTGSLGIVGNSSYYSYTTTNFSLPSAGVGNGYTVSFWVYSAGSGPTTTPHSLMGWCYSSNLGSSAFHAHFSANYEIQFQYGPNSNNLINYTNASTYYTGSWHHIVLTVACNSSDPNTCAVTLYINNTQKSQISQTTYYTGTIGKYNIGHRADLVESWYTGYIDQFKHYNRVLTTSEISNLYNNGVGY